MFLIRRARDMRFLGGYYAFPGGKVDLADRSRDALARSRGLSPEAAARAIGDPADEVPALAYWLAGVREVFEETGVLLARDAEGRPVAAGAPDVAPGSRANGGPSSAASARSPRSWPPRTGSQTSARSPISLTS